MAKVQITLSSKEFFFLHDSLLQRFAEENPEYTAPNIRQHYGFILYHGDEDLLRTTPNLQKSIETNTRVKSYLESINKNKPKSKSLLKENESKPKSIIETRYGLYQHFVDLKKEQGAPSNVKINDVLLTIFLKYLDYDSIEAFRKASENAHPPTHYRMLFYSILFHRIEECDLWIDYATSPIQVKMQRFHLDVKNPPFQGLAFKKGYHFYINLTCESRGGEEFKMICNAGPVTDPEQWEVMPAAFMGISSQGVPTCGEAIIVKESSKEFNNDLGLKRLQGALMLKRHRFNIKSSEIRSVLNLTANGIPVSEWDYIVGTYKVYGVDYSGAWHQAKVEINPETYEAFYETSIFGEISSLRRVRGEINITSATGNMVVCLTTKSQTNWGRDMISSVMVDLGALQNEKRPALASFVTLGRHGGRVVSGEIMIMKTADNFEVRPLIQEEKQDLIDKYKEAKYLDEKWKAVQSIQERP